MIDKYKSRSMKEKDAKILNAICSFYKFNVDSFNSKKVSNNIVLKTTKNASVVTVARRCNQSAREVLTVFLSTHEIIEKILTWADHFSVCEDGKIVYMKNFFLGCNTLEDVLIMKDLHSDDVEAEL